VSGVISPYGSTALLQPTGTAAGDAALIEADLAQIMANTFGGTIDMGAGTWHMQGGLIPPIDCHGKSITFRWQPGAYIACSGAGDMIRQFDSSNLVTRQIWGGGIQGMPTFDGSATSGIACAYHAGDITQLACFGQSQNFGAGAYAPGNSSKGLWLDNQWWWTEQLYGRWVSQSCATNVQFDNSTLATNPNATGSFDRLDLDVFINQNGVGDGVVWNNGALTINYYLGMKGNFKPSTGTVYTALRVMGQNPGGASFLGAGNADGGKGLFVGLECDGSSGTLPTTMNFSASPFTFVNSSGGIYFSNFAPSNNSGGHFQFLGPIQGDPTLTGMQGLENPSITFAIATGSTFFNQWYGFIRATLAAAATGLIMQAGTFDGQPVTIRNTSAANSMTFAIAGTSLMARGVSEVIAPLTDALYHWDAGTSLWYRSL
jgi:hypothetical protein